MTGRVRRGAGGESDYTDGLGSTQSAFVLQDERPERGWITQTEARARLKTLMDGIPPPKPTREGYDKPEERLRMRRIGWLQHQADRILLRKRA